MADPLWVRTIYNVYGLACIPRLASPKTKSQVSLITKERPKIGHLGTPQKVCTDSVNTPAKQNNDAIV